MKKVTSNATTVFFYDDWNLIEERIEYENGTTTTIKYYWDKDLSGSLQGAGGVGGLLYLTVSNSISQLELYIPCYDNNGNITKYVDANGNVVASYTYDAFGKLIAKAGVLADFFRHRFSTKYFDVETELYYYGYRFYSPYLMRWLNRDPIEEDGGLNLYGFCGNNHVCRYDKDGRAYFAKRQLSGFGWYKGFSQNGFLDLFDAEISHEQLFFGTPDNPLDDIGYFNESVVTNDRHRGRYEYVVTSSGFNDCVMRKAVALVNPKPYNFIAKRGFDNCQSYAESLRNKYYELERDPKVQCECFGVHRNALSAMIR